MPRPTRLRPARACAGFRLERFSCSLILDPDQMADLPKHACKDGPLVMLDAAADLAEAKRPQGTAVLAALPDLATNLGYPDFGHSRSPPPAPTRLLAPPPEVRA